MQNNRKETNFDDLSLLIRYQVIHSACECSAVKRLNVGIVYYVILIITRVVLSRPWDFFFLHPKSHLLPRDGYYSYIPTVSMLLRGSHLSREIYMIYANLCIISVFHTAQYCVKNEWIFNTPRHKSRIPFRLHLTSRGRLHAIRYLRLYSAVLSALSIFP